MTQTELPSKFRAVFLNSLSLDFGRVLAASIIFYFHIGLGTSLPLSTCGEFAVEYFVILSGIAYLLFSSSRPSTFPEYRKYLKKRLTGVLPFFLLTNVALYGAAIIFPEKLGRSYSYSFAEFLASTAGISMFLGWKYMSAVMWFIPFIIQVYLLLPLLDWCGRRLQPVLFMLAALAISYLLATLAGCVIKDPRLLDSACKNWTPLTRLPEVCAGLIVARSVLAPRQFWRGMLAVALFGLFSFALSQPSAGGKPPHMYLPWGGFLVPLIILLIPALFSPVLRLIKPAWVHFAGVASFPFFLIHAAPTNFISHRFGNTLPVWAAYYLFCWLLSAGLILGTKPLGAVLNRWDIRILPSRSTQ
jgi:peptidoglycan/LPS O-acetylase OafA/YrhL